jgi:hypothetical protein
MRERPGHKRSIRWNLDMLHITLRNNLQALACWGVPGNAQYPARRWKACCARGNCRRDGRSQSRTRNHYAKTTPFFVSPAQDKWELSVNLTMHQPFLKTPLVLRLGFFCATCFARGDNDDASSQVVSTLELQVGLKISTAPKYFYPSLATSSPFSSPPSHG